MYDQRSISAGIYSSLLHLLHPSFYCHLFRKLSLKPPAEIICRTHMARNACKYFADDVGRHAVGTSALLSFVNFVNRVTLTGAKPRGRKFRLSSAIVIWLVVRARCFLPRYRQTSRNYAIFRGKRASLLEQRTVSRQLESARTTFRGAELQVRRKKLQTIAPTSIM